MTPINGPCVNHPGRAGAWMMPGKKLLCDRCYYQQEAQVEPDKDEAVERLAWYLHIENDDMGHEQTAATARLVWENPRHKARQVATERARRYLEAAAGRLHAGRAD